MRWHLIFALPILAITLLGCLSKPVSSTSGVDIGGTLLVEIWASSDCTRPGDKITIRATVTNKGSRTQVIELQDQPVLDIWVGSATSVLARWSDGKTLTPELTRLELKPNESKTIEMDWLIVQPPSGTVLSFQAPLVYSPRFPPLRPSVLVSVSVCPGPFGP